MIAQRTWRGASRDLSETFPSRTSEKRCSAPLSITAERQMVPIDYDPALAAHETICPEKQMPPLGLKSLFSSTYNSMTYPQRVETC